MQLPWWPRKPHSQGCRNHDGQLSEAQTGQWFLESTATRSIGGRRKISRSPSLTSAAEIVTLWREESGDDPTV
jgi:hypothetical protein